MTEFVKVKATGQEGHLECYEGDGNYIINLDDGSQERFKEKELEFLNFEPYPNEHNAKTIYSYDNYRGDKGIILADSYEEAVEIYKKEYPDRQIAQNDDEYYRHGCYIEEVDYPVESTIHRLFSTK